MSPAEIVETTGAVARSFGEDIAHDVCCVYLDTQPMLRSEPIRWWRRTASYMRNRQRDKAAVRRAPRYWAEVRYAVGRRISTPEDTAACWELVDRVPTPIALALVGLEGVRGDHTVERTRQQVLRRQAMRYARLTSFLVALALAIPAWAGQNVLTWTDASSNEQNFNIERKAEPCAGGSAFTPLATVGLNVVTFTDLAVSEGQTYCYRVSASNTAGASAFSNTAARTVPFTVPNAPSGLSVN